MITGREALMFAVGRIIGESPKISIKIAYRVFDNQERHIYHHCSCGIGDRQPIELIGRWFALDSHKGNIFHARAYVGICTHCKLTHIVHSDQSAQDLFA